MGDPKFFVNAVGLEFAFIALAVISFKKLKFALIPNMIIATIVIIGNTVSPQHVEIMSSFNPLENAMILIIGGYILQGTLLSSSAFAVKNIKTKKR